MAADLTVIDGTHNALDLIELGEVHLTDSAERFLEVRQSDGAADLRRRS
jgi:hypothetical protein